MKTKYWIVLFAFLLVACALFSLPLFTGQDAQFAQVVSQGQVIQTVNLSVDQEFSVGGHNTITVRDGKIAVTWADCPDGYCMAQGFCSGGRDIVCLPNRLVITFMGEQEIDAVVG